MSKAGYRRLLKLEIAFDIGDRVLMKESGGIIGTVTGLRVDPSSDGGYSLTYNISHWKDGSNVSSNMYDFELEPVPIPGKAGFKCKD